MKNSKNLNGLVLIGSLLFGALNAQAQTSAPQTSCEQQRADQWKAFQNEKLSYVMPEMNKMFSTLSTEEYQEINNRFFGPRDEAEYSSCMEKCEVSSGNRNSSDCSQFCEQVGVVDKIKAASDLIVAKTGVEAEYSDIESGVTREFLADYSNDKALAFGFEVTLRFPKGDAWFKTPYKNRKKFEFSVLGSPNDKNLKVEVCTTDLINGPGICTAYQGVSEYMESQLPSTCAKLNSEEANNYYRVSW